jgi:hypothetical protein
VTDAEEHWAPAHALVSSFWPMVELLPDAGEPDGPRAWYRPRRDMAVCCFSAVDKVSLSHWRILVGRGIDLLFTPYSEETVAVLGVLSWLN